MSREGAISTNGDIKNLSLASKSGEGATAFDWLY